MNKVSAMSGVLLLACCAAPKIEQKSAWQVRCLIHSTLITSPTSINDRNTIKSLQKDFAEKRDPIYPANLEFIGKYTREDSTSYIFMFEVIAVSDAEIVYIVSRNGRIIDRFIVSPTVPLDKDGKVPECY